MFDGWNQSVPSSSTSASISASARDQPRDRIVGEVRVGDMALRARHVDPDVDRAAPPDLDRVAEPLRPRSARRPGTGRGRCRARAIRSISARRAVDRRAFLVAGDDQADRARRPARAPRPRRRRRSRPSCRPRRARRAGRRASRGANGAAGPALARRHDVEMAGEGEMRRRRRRASRAGSRPAHRAPRPSTKRSTAKPSGTQRRFEHVEHRARARA